MKGKSGGARQGAGRYITRIVLPRESARSLRVLLAAQGTTYTAENASRYVAELVEREWRAYDDQLAAVETWNGSVL